MIEIINGRVNPQIDPYLTVWEWQIPAYLFLGGLVAGLMILNGLWRLRAQGLESKTCVQTGAIWAPILLSLGMLFLFLDIAYKTHVFRFYTTFKIASPMSWGSWILILVYPLQIAALALPGGLSKLPVPFSVLNPIWQLIQSVVKKWDRQIALGNVLMGIGLGMYTGVLLSVNSARPLWGAMLVPLFLVSGFSTATAWNILSRPETAEKNWLLKLDILAIIVELGILAVLLVNLLTGHAGQQEAVKLILGGSFTATFWVFVIGLGLLLPLWLEGRELRQISVPHWLGPVLVLVGGLVLRIVLVEAGQVSFLPELEQVFSMLR